MKTWVIIILSFILAAILTILPLPGWLAWFRPQWLMLILIYWLIIMPEHIGFGFAWCCGLIADLLNSTLLGEHALAFIIIAYITLKLHRQIRLFPVWQQAMVIFVLTLIMHTLLTSTQKLLGQSNDMRFWLSSIMDFLIWPIIWGLLNMTQRRIRIY
jgi:rod shape-determining protein MreD